MDWMNGLSAMGRTAIALCLLVAPPALAQVSSLEPATPMTGSPLTVRYLPDAADAALGRALQRFALLELESANGTTILWMRLERGSDGAESASFPLPPDAERGTVRFFAYERYARGDEPATLKFVVTSPEGHGILPSMSDDEIAQRVRDYRSSHPLDVSAVRAKWRVLAERSTSDTLAQVIRADLAELDSAGLVTPEARSLRVTGLWLIGERDAAFSHADALVTESPASREAIQAVASMSSASPGPDAARWVLLLRRVAEVAPAAECIRGSGLAAMARDGSVPLALVDRCAEELLAQRPGDARPLLEQIAARAARTEDLGRVDGLASRAIEQMLSRDFRPVADPSGTITEPLLRDLLLLRSRLAMDRGDGAAALLYAAAARGISTADPGDAPEAMDRAWGVVTGAPTTPPETHAMAATTIETSVASPEQPAAQATTSETPDFALKDLDGTEVRLADLRGRVVVLNFWFVACKPCRLEMPKLNEIVARFEGKDVQFLGLCLDGSDAVRQSLGEGEFRYRTLVDAGTASSAFRVRAYPTHIVVDRTGKVVLYRVGGGDADMQAVVAAVEAALAQ